MWKFLLAQTEELLKTKELSLTIVSPERFVVMLLNYNQYVNFDIAAQSLNASLPCLYL